MENEAFRKEQVLYDIIKHKHPKIKGLNVTVNYDKLNVQFQPDKNHTPEIIKLTLDEVIYNVSETIRRYP